jgi:hypothetical protein
MRFARGGCYLDRWQCFFTRTFNRSHDLVPQNGCVMALGHDASENLLTRHPFID